jgi:hypothetical protein
MFAAGDSVIGGITLAGVSETLGGNPVQCHFVHYTSHRAELGIEPRPLPSEPQHGNISPRNETFTTESLLRIIDI